MGCQDFPSENFCLTVPKNSEGNTSVLCSRKIPVAKNYMDRKRGYQDFPSETFCLTVPKNFVGKPFCAVFQEISGSQKDYGLEKGGISRFSVEKFFSHNAENFRN